MSESRKGIPTLKELNEMSFSELLNPSPELLALIVKALPELKKANLYGADLSRANLSGANLSLRD